jgi:hypothetical protein
VRLLHRLEPYAVKVACTVLREEGGRKTTFSLGEVTARSSPYPTSTKLSIDCLAAVGDGSKHVKHGLVAHQKQKKHAFRRIVIRPLKSISWNAMEFSLPTAASASGTRLRIG